MLRARTVRTGLETRESAACSNPDGAVGLLGESVQIAIIPRQTVPGIVVAPARAIPHVNAPLCPHPHAPRCIEVQEIYESVAAASLDAFLDRYATTLADGYGRCRLRGDNRPT